MNIQPLSLNLPTYNSKLNLQKSLKDNANTRPNIIKNINHTNSVSNISFGRVAQNAEPLRALMEYGIPGMYSGKIVISPNKLNELFQNETFSKPIEELIKDLAPFEQSLHTVELAFLNIVKAFAKTNGQMKLTDVIKKIAPEHDKKILEQQAPIFNELDKLANNLPQETKKEYKNLMELTYQKLRRYAVVQPFSAKEFKYKLKRIADEMYQKADYNNADIVKEMIQLAKKIPEKTPEEISDFKNISSKVIKNRKIKFNKKLTKRRADLLTQVEIIAMQTELKNNGDLNKLLAQTRAKIYGIPIIIPFNRKSFIYELQKITEKIEDKKLARQMIKQATLLPTSHDNLSAFIMKCTEYTNDKIGFTMLSGSIGNIDHIVPFSKKGKDSIENYGISSTYYNSERAERSFAQQLKKRPETYNNCQKQVDRLIELCNNGIFQKVKLSKFYIINFVTRLFNLSPEENRLVLNIDRLNVTNEEREHIRTAFTKTKYPFSHKFKTN